MSTVLSDTKCTLGEGAFWHPLRGTFFWFDILGKRLYEMTAEGQRDWAFDECHSAAGWLSESALMVASETGLYRLDLDTGARERIVALEADDPVTRSNDGRADPQGGFWIGTMGFGLETGKGAIYRYYRGEVRKLYPGISIPNAICFAPDGQSACFTDTVQGVIQRVRLDAQGWPTGAPEPFIDLRAEGLKPDGAVIDAEGRLWNAQWGASRVAVYGTDGAFLQAFAFPASQISCPCMGGADLSTLYATSAAVGLPDEDAAGRTFCLPVAAKGVAEPQVIL